MRRVMHVLILGVFSAILMFILLPASSPIQAHSLVSPLESAKDSITATPSALPISNNADIGIAGIRTPLPKPVVYLPDTESTPHAEIFSAPAAPSSCANNYTFTTATGEALVPGIQDSGNHCDDCVTTIGLPFPFTLYDATYTTVNVSSNGNLQFRSANSDFTNSTLPTAVFNYAIAPYWDDLVDTSATACNGGPCGIYVSTSGNAPNRIFNIEWRAVDAASGTKYANFEVRLYEGQSQFDLVYDTVADAGGGATVGVQQGTGDSNGFTQFEYNTGGLSSGLKIAFTLAPCPTLTPTATPTCGGPGSWSNPAPYPIGIVDNAVVAQANRLYSFSGAGAGALNSAAYKYNPEANTWTALAAVPAARAYASAVSDGTYIYLLGGIDGAGHPTRDLVRYDPVTDHYTTLADSTLPTWAQAAAYVNGKIYKIGGLTTDGSYTNNVEVYDTATGTWSTLSGNGVYPRNAGFLMAVSYNGYIYTAGGTAGTDRDFLKTYRYDPGTNSWNDLAVPDLPATRWGSATGIYNNQWIIAGGSSNRAPTNSVVALDLQAPTNGWIARNPLASARTRLGGASVGDAFYAVGGRYDNTTQGTGDNQRYAERSCNGTPTPTPPSTATATPTTNPGIIQGAITDTDLTQAGRFVRDWTPGTCGTTNTMPDLADTAARHYDAYNFINNTAGSVCVTVQLDSACTGSNDVFSVSYLGGFNPADIQTNYRADLGASPGQLGGTTSYAFDVPAGQAFTVTVYEVTPGAGCNAYTLHVTGASLTENPTLTPTPITTPTATATPTTGPAPLQGAINSSDPTQAGRFVRDWTPSTCGTTKTMPDLADTAARHYDAYNFINNTANSVCVTVQLDSACTGSNDIFSVAYLGTYNPANIETNYRADLGASPGQLGGTTSSAFDVPAGQTFVITVYEVTAGAGCNAYTLHVSAGSPIASPTNTPTPVATPTATATSTPLQGAINSSDPTQAGRFVRDWTPSTCGTTNTMPDLADTTARHYDAYSFTNSSTSAVCITVRLDSACTDSNDIFSVAYLGTYNPANIETNYLADLGASPGQLGGTTSYAFEIPAGQTFVITVYEVTAGAGCSAYTLSVASDSSSHATASKREGSTTTAASPLVEAPYRDMPVTDPRAGAVQYLGSHGIISGYKDGSFRPAAPTTRGQLVKIIVRSFAVPAYTPRAGGYTFADIPPTHPFFAVTEAAAHAQLISGYPCGGPKEPCDAASRPYFRPNEAVTRGQLAKIITLARGWAIPDLTGATFADVPPNSAFFPFTEAIYCHKVITGYICGSSGEPCDDRNRPYFHPDAPATRGQVATIVYQALTGHATCSSVPVKP